MRYSFIQTEKAIFPVVVLCRVLRVSRSGFYVWCLREPSDRAVLNQKLLERIRSIHQQSRGTYGSPRVHEGLKREGFSISLNRVARLMRENGIRSCYGKKRRFPKTTDSNHHYPVAENHVARNFVVSAPNQIWVSDITYIPTEEGWLYLAVILDLYARRIVGWSMKPHLGHVLAKEALEMAIEKRRAIPDGIIHHSDRGVQYAAEGFQEVLEEQKIVCSMSRKGNCLDNAVAESFFKTLKVELTHRKRFATHQEAKTAIFEYMEVFYNRERYHSTLDYQTPVEYETKYFNCEQNSVH